MDRLLLRSIFASCWLLACLAFAAEPKPDGTLKITTRMISPGIGLSWGDGVLTHKGQDYPFTFQAKGMFRDVDSKITAGELSGQVFNLKSVAVFNGTYHKDDAKAAVAGAGSRVTMKNSNGVIVNLTSTVEGRKFTLGRDGISIQLEKPKR
jgi:hypothetical protein